MFEIYFSICHDGIVSCLFFRGSSVRLEFMTFSDFDSILASPNLSAAVDLSTGVDYTFEEAV